MIRGLKLCYERALVAAFALLFFASTGWSGWTHRELKRIHANPVGVHIAKSVYQPLEWATFESTPPPWKSPLSQPAGSGWLFELFTPPAVYFNQATSQFVVTSPTNEKKTDVTFALELVAVRRELYRVQLSGYFGEPNRYTATFSQPGKPGILFAREGGRLAGQELTLVKFDFRRVSPRESNLEITEKIAFAELRDDRTREMVILNGREPGYMDAPVATVKLNPGDALREVRVGDVVIDGKMIYRIGRLNYSPAEMVVTCEESGTSRVETKILRPGGTDASALAIQSLDSSVHLPRLATGFITPEK